MIVKIAHDKEIHLYRGEVGFNRLKKHCQSVFKVLPATFEFFYFDTDGDKITVNSQQDLDIIFEAQEKTSIKKLYIQEIDNEFQMLRTNPEESEHLPSEYYCPLPIDSSSIRVVNLVKEGISKKEKELMERESKRFLLDLEQDIVDKMMEEENKLIGEAVSMFIEEELTHNVAKKIIQEEERMIKDEVSVFMGKMVDGCARKMSKMPTNDKGVQKEMTITDQTMSKNEILIDRLVQQKIKSMMPSLIKQISRAVEAKISIEGCTKCCKAQKETKKYQLRHHEA